MHKPDNDNEGLAPWAVRALGFDRMCRCGHSDGQHDSDGECAVLGCKCCDYQYQPTEGSK